VRSPALAAACAAATLGLGCHEGLTEVVVVVKSDVQPQGPWSVVVAGFVAQRERPHFPVAQPDGHLEFPSHTGSPLLPVAIQLLSEGKTPAASGVVILSGKLPGGDPVLVERAVSDLRFVPHETRMLVLNLGADCIVCRGAACPVLPPNGANYPTTLDYSWANLSETVPGCDVVNPPLQAFDATIAKNAAALSWER
jgi:hypothetical protein